MKRLLLLAVAATIGLSVLYGCQPKEDAGTPAEANPPAGQAGGGATTEGTQTK